MKIMRLQHLSLVSVIILNHIILLGCASVEHPKVNTTLLILDDLINTANSEYLEGNYARAEILARKALNLDACNSIALDIVGLSRLKVGDIDEAQRHFEEAVKCNPSYSKGYAHLAVVAYFKNDHVNSWKLLQVAYDINPVDREIEEVKNLLLSYD